MTVARWDLDGLLMRVGNVLDLDPVLVSRHLNERPAMADGVLHWPARDARAGRGDLGGHYLSPILTLAMIQRLHTVRA